MRTSVGRIAMRAQPWGPASESKFGRLRSAFQERKGLVSGCCPKGATQFRIIRGAGKDHPADAKGHDRLRTALCIARTPQGFAVDIRHAADEVGISLLR